ACAPDRLQFSLQLDDFVLQDTSVSFDLGFARTSKEPGTAALAFQVGPRTHKAAALVIEMRKLDLQRAFLGARPLAEDLEDKASTVENLGVQHLLEIALLHRRERMIDDDKLRLRVGDDSRDFVKLAGADQGGWPRIRDHDDLAMDRLQIDRERKADCLFEPGP